MAEQRWSKDHRQLIDDVANDLGFAPTTILNIKQAARTFDRFCREVGDQPGLRTDYSATLLAKFADWLIQTHGYGTAATGYYQSFTMLLSALYIHEDVPRFTMALPPFPFPGARRVSRPAEPISDAFTDEVFVKLTAEAMRIEALHAEAERLRVAATNAPDLFSRRTWGLGEMPPETIVRAILERPREIMPTRSRPRTPEEVRITTAIQLHHPGLQDVFRMLSGVTRSQLMPFFGLFALTSGHVPSSIARFDIHALSPIGTDGRHYRLEANKPRAGRIVPLIVEDTGPNSVPDLFERLVTITERVRAEAGRDAPELAEYLFICRNTHSLAINALATQWDHGHGSGYRTAFSSAMRRLGLHLTRDDADTIDSLDQLRRFGRHTNPRRLRATRIHKIAQTSRTLGEVSDRIGHRSPHTTAGYLRTMATGAEFQTHQRAIVNDMIARFTAAARVRARATSIDGRPVHDH